MKVTEQLFELANYDSKNITNKGHKSISQADLDKIESEGVTLEFLQSLKVPVFKYRTQMTIHGYFPELQNNYIGGYKNIFQNKNKSIGVKWQAVDFEKKTRIYKAIKDFCPGWFIRHNSTEFLIEKTSPPLSRAEVKAFVETEKAQMAKIDKSLFFGNSGMYLGEYFGQFFVVSYINIGAILETNVTKCIENIAGASMSEIEAKQAADKARQEAEYEQRKLERLKEIETKRIKQAPLMEAARKVLIENGYIFKEKVPIEEGIYIEIQPDIETNQFNFVGYQFTKEPRQKKWRMEICESPDLNFTFKGGYHKSETIKNFFSGYVKPVAEEKPVENDIQVVDYSEKAVAIFGDTKRIKDKIKEIGGKFNPFLTHNGQKQPGWILPATKKTAAVMLIMYS